MKSARQEMTVSLLSRSGSRRGPTAPGSGAGIVTVEMTDVEGRGRIAHGYLGLWSDHNEASASRAPAGVTKTPHQRSFLQ